MIKEDEYDSDNDPMVGQCNQPEYVLETYPSASQFSQPYSIDEHAETTFQYFRKLREEGKFNDVTVESNGNHVLTANRLVLASFSSQLEAALLGLQQSNQIILNLEEKILGINANDIYNFVEYMYTGEFKVTKRLRKTVDALGSKALKILLRDAEDGTVLRDESHSIRFQRQLQTYRTNGWFLDCNVLIGNKGCLKCHRLVLCAHSLNIEEPLINTFKVNQVHLDLQEYAAKMSQLDLKNILDFAYCGVVRGGRRRYPMMKVMAYDLGIMKLHDLLAAQFHEDETDQQTSMEVYTDYDLPVLTPVDQDYPEENEDDYHDYEQEEYQQSLEDVTAQATEDYISIYEEFVVGPRRGRRGGTYGLNKNSQSVLMRENTIILNEDIKRKEQAMNEKQSSDLVSYIPTRTKKQKAVDSYGYGVPEYHTTNEVEVPRVFGNQKEMIEKPFKCPHCDHRTKEKSGIAKHVRSVHTGEAPYQCNFCSMCFKIQSNLVRHIRAHTGEKPYACKKCGVAYADKKNMDAHIFREHLKTQMIVCSFSNCGKRFWRHDRFSSHCQKIHGSLPTGSIAQLPEDII